MSTSKQSDPTHHTSTLVVAFVWKKASKMRSSESRQQARFERWGRASAVNQSSVEVARHLSNGDRKSHDICLQPESFPRKAGHRKSFRTLFQRNHYKHTKPKLEYVPKAMHVWQVS